MRSLRASALDTLLWLRPVLVVPRYALCSDEERFATLEYDGHAQRRAIGTAADGVWAIERSDDAQLPVVLTSVHGASVAATFVYNVRHSDGTLTTASGEVYSWQPQNFWRTDVQWRDASGAELVALQQTPSVTKHEVRVKMAARAREVPHTPLLVLVGEYLMLWQQQERIAALRR